MVPKGADNTGEKEAKNPMTSATPGKKTWAELGSWSFPRGGGAGQGRAGQGKGRAEGPGETPQRTQGWKSYSSLTWVLLTTLAVLTLLTGFPEPRKEAFQTPG